LGWNDNLENESTAVTFNIKVIQVVLQKHQAGWMPAWCLLFLLLQNLLHLLQPYHRNNSGRNNFEPLTP
jgi:hypothetical protein